VIYPHHNRDVFILRRGRDDNPFCSGYQVALGHLGVAVTFNVEDTFVTPAMRIIAHEEALRVSGKCNF
jgi:hypothetical protein